MCQVLPRVSLRRQIVQLDGTAVVTVDRRRIGRLIVGIDLIDKDDLLFYVADVVALAS